jgi:ribose-phosphate pyrophosphokinase
MIKLNGEKVPVTVFPDGTHQVWKLTDSQMNYASTSQEVEVFWDFENQSEVFDVMQLANLLTSIEDGWQKSLVLNCPYLPYGRQDKLITNKSCFALNTFIFNAMSSFHIIRTVDAHNIELFRYSSIIVENTFPIDVINSIISNENVDLIVFPDKGAAERYEEFVPEGIKFISAEKTRDQLTGAILGITIDSEAVSEASNVLVWDDICDGGATFISLASHFKPTQKLMLYVSHGIFSKGTGCLFSAGYNKLFTRNGEVR